MRGRAGASSSRPPTETASIGQNALATKRSSPPSGNSSGERGAAGEHGDAEQGRAAQLVAAPDDAGDRGQQQEGAGDGAGQHAAEREHRRGGAPRAAGALERGPGAHGERDAERERHPADDEVREDAEREQPGRGGRRGGAVRRAALRERGEQRDGRDGRQRARPQRAGPDAQRREHQRVAQHVMTAVPLGVPDGQSFVREQPRAVRMARHVGGRRRPHEVGRRCERRGEHGRMAVRERAPHGAEPSPWRCAANARSRR